MGGKGRALAFAPTFQPPLPRGGQHVQLWALICAVLGGEAVDAELSSRDAHPLRRLLRRGRLRVSKVHVVTGLLASSR